MILIQLKMYIYKLQDYIDFAIEVRGHNNTDYFFMISILYVIFNFKKVIIVKENTNEKNEQRFI